MSSVERIPLERFEVPSGTPVFDWEVPREWNVRAAWIEDESGRRIVDLRDHTLHLMSYSTPVDAVMSLDELQPHLHSIPEHPDWIPYRTSYYRDAWGFCLTHRLRESLKPGKYRVRIDSTLQPGTLTYAESFVPGAVPEEVLIFTHVCHPSLCNDNLTGIALATELVEHLRRASPHFSYRFVFGPGTIGSITWLARNEQNVHRVRHGLVLGLAGDRGPLTYKRSRQGVAQIDRIGAYVLSQLAPGARVVDFSPYGYDERQLCSPGFDLPDGPADALAQQRISRISHLGRQLFDPGPGRTGGVAVRDRHDAAHRGSQCLVCEPESEMRAAPRQARAVPQHGWPASRRVRTRAAVGAESVGRFE